jgi:hypothetical protein
MQNQGNSGHRQGEGRAGLACGWPSLWPSATTRSCVFLMGDATGSAMAD